MTEVSVRHPSEPKDAARVSRVHFPSQNRSSTGAAPGIIVDRFVTPAEAVSSTRQYLPLRITDWLRLTVWTPSGSVTTR